MWLEAEWTVGMQLPAQLIQLCSIVIATQHQWRSAPAAFETHQAIKGQCEGRVPQRPAGGIGGGQQLWRQVIVVAEEEQRDVQAVGCMGFFP